MPKAKRPTQARLHELLSYDPETGVFVRKSGVQRGPIGRKYGRIGAGRISELGYVLLMIDGVNYIAGQVAWTYVHGAWPHARIKYIDGDKLNNRIDNIRVQDRDRADTKAEPLSLERLKELLNYDPESGWFTWRISSSVAKPGDRAGGMHGLGYRSIGIDYKKYLEHTLAYFYMTGEWPTHEIDHKNRVKADNRWDNLVHATRSQNGHNKGLSQRSTSGYPGVMVHGSKYRTGMSLNGKDINLGWHKTIAQARIARLLGEKKHFGSFTTWKADRDGVLPLGDQFIALMLRDNKLFVLGPVGQPYEVTDASQIEVLPVNDAGEVLQ